MRTERSRWLGVLLQREYVDPSDAFESIYKEVVEPLLAAIERLVQVAAGPSADGQRVVVRVYCIISQLTNMRPVGRSSTGGWFFGITPLRRCPALDAPLWGASRCARRCREGGV